MASDKHIGDILEHRKNTRGGLYKPCGTVFVDYLVDILGYFYYNHLGSRGLPGVLERFDTLLDTPPEWEQSTLQTRQS